jgi:hypothetical protein
MLEEEAWSYHCENSERMSTRHREPVGKNIHLLFLKRERTIVSPIPFIYGFILLVSQTIQI